MRRQLYTNKGFTLIELMLTLVISIVIIAAIYAAYSSQRDTYLAQEQVAEMQQNLRAAMDLIVRDIRMAGFDPTKNANAGIISPTSSGLFTFTKDITGGETDTIDNDFDLLVDGADAADEELYGDGDIIDTNEVVTYGFSVADDPDRDGVANSGAASFARQNYSPTGVPGGFQAIADNIGAVEFLYILKDGKGKITPTVTDLDDIRGVQVTMLARAHYPDRKFTNSIQYEPPRTNYPDVPKAAWGPYNDNFRRRFVTMTIQARNMGL